MLFSSTRMGLISKIGLYIALILLVCSCNKDLTLIQTAWDQYDQKRFDECLKTLEQIQVESCEKSELKGHCYWSLKMFNSAIPEYQKYINACEGDLTVFNNLGDCFFKLDQGDSAYHYFIKASEIDVSNQIVNFNLGMIHYTSSYYQDAKLYFRKAIDSSDALNLDYYEMLIKTFNALNEYDSSFWVADELLKQTNDPTKFNRVRLTKVLVYSEMGKHEELISEIKSLIPDITDSINLFNAHHNMALSYYVLKDSVGYCKNYNLAKSLRPDIKTPKYFECQ